MFGSRLTGIGALLAVLGFGALLYAQSLEDDVNEIFLKRCWWGTHEADDQRVEGRYAKGAPPAAGEARLAWTERSLLSESEAFQLLSTGMAATLQWHDNWGADTLQATVEAGENDGTLRVAWTLDLLTTGGRQRLAAGQASHLLLDEAKGRYVFDLTRPLTDQQQEHGAGAEFKYTVFRNGTHDVEGRDQRNRIGSDVLKVAKDD